MNRRRFLKYAGATAAVLGTSALGFDQLLNPRLLRSTTTSNALGQVSIATGATSNITSTSITSGKSAKLVELSFYYDPNLNGLMDPSELELRNLTIKIGGQSVPGSKVAIPSDSTVDLAIYGNSPVGKGLTTATYNEPHRPVALPTFQFHSSTNDASIGLADGPATSPIKPSEMNIEDYEYFRQHPGQWLSAVSGPGHNIFPPGWPYEPNYFLYGYRIPSGPLAGQPHLAFDIWAADGTPVHACWGGRIVPGLYDWKFGIDSGSQVAYYNHLVPSVKIGDTVQRYDLLGNIEKGLGHVHFELRPDPTAILNIFTTMTAKDALKSPLRGEKVPQLPYFSER